MRKHGDDCWPAVDGDVADFLGKDHVGFRGNHLESTVANVLR